MNAPLRTIPNPEISWIDRAHDKLVDAIAACDRGHLRDARDSLHDARIILDAEEQRRAAKRGQA
jgi:hypothetical protein